MVFFFCFSRHQVALAVMAVPAFLPLSRGSHWQSSLRMTCSDVPIPFIDAAPAVVEITLLLLLALTTLLPFGRLRLSP